MPLDYSKYDWTFEFPYGRALFSGPSLPRAPFPFTPVEETLKTVKIVFYSPAGVKILEIGTDIRDNILESCSFSVGEHGNEKFSISLSEIPHTYLAPRTRVDIHLFGDTARPYYSGFLLEAPPLNAQTKSFQFTGFGFSEQLKWILIDQAFSSMKVNLIVRSLMENWIEPNTDIVYNPNLIEDIDYVVSSISWEKVSAKKVLEELATIAGNFEFGVNENRELYFRDREIDLNLNFNIFSGIHFDDFTPKVRMDKIINRIHIKSGELKGTGDDAGKNWVGTVEDAPSIADYGLREDVRTVPSVLDDALGLVWGQSELNKDKDSVLSGKIENISIGNSRVEAAGKARVWMTLALDSGWVEQLTNLGTRVPDWDWDSISITDVWTGQIFWDYAGTNLYTFCFELFIKQISWKVGTDFSIDAELGEVEDFLSDEFFNIELTVRRSEILEQQNTKSLYDLT